MVEAGSLRPARVSSQKEMAPGIYLLCFPRNLDFEAGQVISLALEKDGARRLYSICSGEQDPEIGILYNVVEEGYLTPKLSDVKEGDELWYSEARGEFTCGTEAAVWIAAGTGIAPFYAMLQSGKAAHKILLHGDRTPERFYFEEAFRNALGSHYIPCCSGHAPEGMYHGRVSDYLLGHPLPADAGKYYLCGSAEMVVDTRDILIEKGVPFDSIVSEIYF